MREWESNMTGYFWWDLLIVLATIGAGWGGGYLIFAKWLGRNKK